MNEGVDRRLAQIIEEAVDDDEVEAFIMLDDGAVDLDEDDDRGAGGRLIDRVARDVNQQPSEVRFMPRLGILYVKGSRRLVRRLVTDETVKSASSTETPA